MNELPFTLHNSMSFHLWMKVNVPASHFFYLNGVATSNLKPVMQGLLLSASTY